MRALDILADEHELVRRLLRCLGVLCVQARTTGRLDPEATPELLSLLAAFVDGSHQDKEELLLFPLMLARASNAEALRLQRLCGEHAKERRRLLGMHLHMQSACQGSLVAVERFIAHAVLYSRLQNKHIDEEERYMLPLAAILLSSYDHEELARSFAKNEARSLRLRDVRAQVDALCQRFGVVFPAEPAPPAVLVPRRAPVRRGAETPGMAADRGRRAGNSKAGR